MCNLFFERVRVLIGDVVDLTIMVELFGLFSVLVSQVSILSLVHIVVFTEHLDFFIRLLLCSY